METFFKVYLPLKQISFFNKKVNKNHCIILINLKIIPVKTLLCLHRFFVRFGCK